ELSRPPHRRQPLITVAADGHDAHRDVRGSGVDERLKALLDGRLAPGGEDVADLAGVAGVEQALIVRRYLGFGEDAVRSFDGGVDLVVAAQAHGDTSDDARREPAGRL